MKRFILTSLCILFAANFALADYIELPVKWSQLPALGQGFDYISNSPSGVTRADDFICTDPAAIVAVRWWGSYLGEYEHRPNQPGYWKDMEISFHLSDRNDHPYSLPLDPPLSLQRVLAQEEAVGIDAQGEPVYMYNAYLNMPFEQEQGVEYFMDIIDPINQNWGWHEAAQQQLDWHALTTPAAGWIHDEPVDLAFELMVPEPATVALLGLGSLTLLRRRRRV